MKVYNENTTVTILRDGEEINIPFKSLREGDVVLGKEGPAFTVGSDAHVSGDADYEGWLVYSDSGEGYFPEDFMKEVSM